MFNQTIRIHIAELGPVRDADLEISDFMIFSGESGLGKSYLAILSHYFSEIFLSNYRLTSFLRSIDVCFNDIQPSLTADEGVITAIKVKDLERWIEKDAIDYLRYMLGDESLTGDLTVSLPDTVPDEIAFSYERANLGLIDQPDDQALLIRVGDLRFRVHDDDIIGEIDPLSKVLGLEMCRLLTGEPLRLTSTYEMPPSRGAFLTEKVFPQSGLYIEFQKFLDYINQAKSRRSTPDDNLVGMMNYLLEGEVVFKDGKFMYISDTKQLPVSAAAASIRELGAIDLLIKNVSIPTSSLLIEEPEAHLHPTKQRLMADILAMILNSGAAIQVTTHSDYFLRRVNELIMMYRIRQIMPEDEFDAFAQSVGIKPDLALNPETINAYLLQRDGDHSVLVKQSLSDGVPFAAFYNAIRTSLDLEDRLQEQLATLEDGKH